MDGWARQWRSVGKKDKDEEKKHVEGRGCRERDRTGDEEQGGAGQEWSEGDG